MTYADTVPLTPAELAENNAITPERGYPTTDRRLYLPPAVWSKMLHSGEIAIPDGPWHIANHPNRQQAAHQHLLHDIATEESPMSAQQITHWQNLGLLVDTAGRPLHPQAAQLLTMPGIGMFTGPGFHWRYGPQRMGNLGLRRERNGSVEYAMAAVQRSTIKWGMPGGYANAGETMDDAAFREGYEEVGVERKALGAIALTAAVLSPPKGFGRDTLHAWGEEWFTFLHSLNNPGLDGIKLETHDEQEVKGVAWVPLDHVRLSLRGKSPYDIMTTHAKMILKHELELSPGRRDSWKAGTR